MDVISHQAIAVQLKPLPFFEVPEGLEKGEIIAVVKKHGLAVVATIDYVVHQPIGNWSQRSRHGDNLPRLRKRYKTQIVLTPFLL